MSEVSRWGVLSRLFRFAERRRGSWSMANPFERRVDEAVEFVLLNVDMQIRFLPGGARSLQGKTILEVGPGQDFGIPLLMMGYGASATLIDRFLCTWDENFHPKYYQALMERAQTERPEIDVTPIKQILRAGDHRAKGLTLLKIGLEEADEIPDGTVDVSLSNATFEHLADPRKACLQLGRITKPHGLGFHQIDFRDHRDFSRPLEYVTLPDSEFNRIFEETFASCGNRWRHTEFAEVFEDAGFDCDFRPNMFADDLYVDDVRGRAQPRYLNMSRDALRTLSGRFHLTKRDPNSLA